MKAQVIIEIENKDGVVSLYSKNSINDNISFIDPVNVVTQATFEQFFANAGATLYKDIVEELNIEEFDQSQIFKLS